MGGQAGSINAEDVSVQKRCVSSVGLKRTDAMYVLEVHTTVNTQELEGGYELRRAGRGREQG